MRLVADSHAILWLSQRSPELSDVAASPELSLHPIEEDVADATTAIPRDVLSDPWDRFIVATAKVLDVPLVTKDRAIRGSKLVPTIW